MTFVQQFQNFISYKDLRNKILITLAILILIRILAHIPLPGVDIQSLKEFFSKNQIFGLLNMFSGGTMENFSIILMGVAPYITASIVMQLLQMIVPALEALSKEGEYGQRRMNQYTRILTVPLAAMQAYAMIMILTRGAQGQQAVIAAQFHGFNLILAIATVTAGTILLMWLGELISENGIGNGISLIITLGIIAGFPAMISRTWALIAGGGIIQTEKILSLALWFVIAIVVLVGIIIVTEGQRNIPVSYARRVRGMRSYGGVDTYLPMRVNLGGVIPIIFAMSIMLFPGTIAQFFKQANSPWLASAATKIASLFEANTVFYAVAYFLLVIAFTYFYTAIVFNPAKIAENLQKQGGFIPGIRPGAETQNYIKKIMYRINLFGGVFLGIVAVLPFIVQGITGVTTLILGGTGVLIIVSVVLETMRQFKSQLAMRSYEYQ